MEELENGDKSYKMLLSRHGMATEHMKFQPLWLSIQDTRPSQYQCGVGGQITRLHPS